MGKGPRWRTVMWMKNLWVKTEWRTVSLLHLTVHTVFLSHVLNPALFYSYLIYLFAQWHYSLLREGTKFFSCLFVYTINIFLQERWFFKKSSLLRWQFMDFQAWFSHSICKSPCFPTCSSSHTPVTTPETFTGPERMILTRWTVLFFIWTNCEYSCASAPVPAPQVWAESHWLCSHGAPDKLGTTQVTWWLVWWKQHACISWN